MILHFSPRSIAVGLLCGLLLSPLSPSAQDLATPAQSTSDSGRAETIAKIKAAADAIANIYNSPRGETGLAVKDALPPDHPVVLEPERGLLQQLVERIARGEATANEEGFLTWDARGGPKTPEEIDSWLRQHNVANDKWAELKRLHDLTARLSAKGPALGPLSKASGVITAAALAEYLLHWWASSEQDGSPQDTVRVQLQSD